MEELSALAGIFEIHLMKIPDMEDTIDIEEESRGFKKEDSEEIQKILWIA